MKSINSVNVFFNASVILAGLRSKKGASGLLLYYVQTKKICGFISEIVWDEVRRNLDKINVSEFIATKSCQHFKVAVAPKYHSFQKYEKKGIEIDDVHLLVSTEENKCRILVSLDKKHILSIKEKIDNFEILSPKELLIRLSH